jgi:cytochrome oxidase assembly protein ShyY1
VFFTPRWILSHLFAATLIISFVAAGFWQINRMSERNELNELIASRMGVSVPLDDVRNDALDTLEFKRVSVTGEFDPLVEVLIANRSDEGTPGFWIWTNFVTEWGDLLVNRGFVGRGVILETTGAQPRSDADVEAGQATIEGLLRVGLDIGRASEDGTQINRPDPGLAVELLDLSPALDSTFYLELDTQAPARSSSIPTPVPEPDLGEGPHRSYAFQWFTFATIGTLGYGAVLARIRRGDQTLGDVPASVNATDRPIEEPSRR